MTNQEAVEICRGWLAHCNRTRERAKQMTKLATKARKGPDEAKEAQHEMRTLQRQPPRVYDGARLEQAVKHLVKVI